VGSAEHGHRSACYGGLLVFAELLPDHGLDESMHLDALSVASSECEPDSGSHDVVKRVWIGGGGAQGLLEQFWVVGEQVQWDRLGCEEGCQVEQLHCGRVISFQAVQG
jgi:hypothetical protein